MADKAGDTAGMAQDAGETPAVAAPPTGEAPTGRFTRAVGRGPSDPLHLGPDYTSQTASVCGVDGGCHHPGRAF